jgi:hypothetical protein
VRNGEVISVSWMDLLDDAWNDAKTLTISVHLEKRDPAAKPEVIRKKNVFFR